MKVKATQILLHDCVTGMIKTGESRDSEQPYNMNHAGDNEPLNRNVCDDAGAWWL